MEIETRQSARRDWQIRWKSDTRSARSVGSNATTFQAMTVYRSATVAAWSVRFERLRSSPSRDCEGAVDKTYTCMKPPFGYML